MRHNTIKLLSNRSHCEIEIVNSEYVQFIKYAEKYSINCEFINC